MLSDELDYDLPAELIAATAAEPRDAARLMVINRAAGGVEHRTIADLARQDSPLLAGDLMVFNRTRVLPAHFTGRRQATGGRVSGLYVESVDVAGDDRRARWQVMLEARGRLQSGQTIRLDAAVDASLQLIESQGGGLWLVEVQSGLSTPALLEKVGRTPLPPYIRKVRKAAGLAELTADDAQRYNTVFASAPGSIAAPTAALHFTPELLRRLDDRGVRRAELTLHVGIGTFTPVRTERLEAHRMHREWVSIPAQVTRQLAAARQAGGRIIVVGTTCVRALESLPDDWQTRGDFEAYTDLFIHPGDEDSAAFAFRFTDALLTNFHLPRSTLIALVAALPGVGIDRIRQWYAEAIARKYRFYSYGDAMLLL